MYKKLLLATLVATSSAFLITPAFAASQIVVSVRTPPPEPRMMATPAARPGHQWVPGYWNWRGNRHVWTNGTWVADRPGYAYHQPRWVQRGRVWQLERGAWSRGDRDGDGVRNRDDRMPNNPRVQ